MDTEKGSWKRGGPRDEGQRQTFLGGRMVGREGEERGRLREEDSVLEEARIRTETGLRERREGGGRKETG